MRSVPELLLVTMLVLSTLACAGDGSPDPMVVDEGPWTTLVDRPCPEDSFLSWENFGDPFMRNWCTGCHSVSLLEAERGAAPMGIDFNSPDGVKSHLERVWVRAGDENRTMPPAGGPGAAERALLGEWLACGAPTRAEVEGL